MTTLKQLTRLHARIAVKNFMRDGELDPPSWLIENEEGKRLLLATPMEGKDMAVVVRHAIREFGGVRYATSMESWFLEYGKDEVMPANVRPSESPRRREGLIIYGEDNKGDAHCIAYEIKRDKNGKPSLEKMPGGMENMAGRLVDMFAVGPYT